jgi:hypothetical protein
MKEISIATTKVNGQTYSVRASGHAVERMEQRGVDKTIVAGNILSLGEKRIAEMHRNNEEAIIIDKQHGISVVIGFRPNVNQVRILTVIPKSNVFVKSNTKVITL